MKGPALSWILVAISLLTYFFDTLKNIRIIAYTFSLQGNQIPKTIEKYPIAPPKNYHATKPHLLKCYLIVQMNKNGTFYQSKPSPKLKLRSSLKDQRKSRRLYNFWLQFWLHAFCIYHLLCPLQDDLLVQNILLKELLHNKLCIMLTLAIFYPGTRDTPTDI